MKKLIFFLIILFLFPVMSEGYNKSKSILPKHLKSIDEPTDTQVPSYDSATKKFEWVDNTGGGSVDPSIGYNWTGVNTFSNIIITGDLTLEDNTLGNILLGDGDSWESKAMSGHVTITSTGVTSLNANDLPADAECLTWDVTTEKFEWAVCGSGTPAGADTQIQYNDGGSFGGISDMVYDDTNIGIGLTAPQAKFQVVGISSFTDVSVSNDVIITDALSSATIDTGQGATEVYAMDQDVEQADGVTFATVDTGEGANDLFDMDQNVLEASAVVFATVNTGQGANELYDMDQNMLVASDVTFEGVTVSDDATVTDDLAVGGDFTVTGTATIGTGSIVIKGTADANATGNIMVADGTDFEGLAMTGHVTITSAGVTSLNAADLPADGELLSWDTATEKFEWVADAGGAETNSLETTTTGNLINELAIGDGSNSMVFVAMNGDMTLDSNGLATLKANKALKVVGFRLDGGGSVITTGQHARVKVPFDMTFTSVEMSGDTTGDISVDFWKDSYANLPADNADSICDAGTCPSITNGFKMQDTSLTSWTTSVSAGDWITVNVDTIGTMTEAEVFLNGTVD